MRYKCESCYGTFEKPETRYINISSGGEIYEEPYGVCPYCGSEGFHEMQQCDVCHEWFDPEEFTGSVCNDCIKDLAADKGMVYKYLSETDQLYEFAAYCAEVKNDDF